MDREITFIPCLVENHDDCEGEVTEGDNTWNCRCECHSKEDS